MELGPKLHRMNDDRIFFRIRADDETTALAGNDPKGIADRMVDVLITDPVHTRAVSISA